MNGVVVVSPCVNVCRMDAATGWCEGCLRTLDEIGAWSVLGDAGKHAVWAALAPRRVHWQASGRELLPMPEQLSQARPQALSPAQPQALPLP